MFQELNCKEVYFPIETESVVKVFQSIYDVDNWKNWCDSSGKSDLPPDFYSDKYKIMMDVMRIDDHAFIGKKGKVVNPTNARESQIQRELREKGICDLFPNAQIIVNAVTSLPTEEDHNYSFYLENYTRTVKQHRNHIEQYRNNHPDYKLIFFIMDESSAYFETEDCIAQKKYLGQRMQGKPHIFPCDKAFVDLLYEIEIDYLIWYAPFKLIKSDMVQIQLPKACVIDMKELKKIDTIAYDKSRMTSCEL